ncbi:hypothetical protein LV475_08840 [Guyparkeria hydrothermalis]|uniref:FimV/HubP family polar landmark protein n=1 Tax=Guyparkeria TaxID=2035712 RepID=UPI0010AB6E83|nr:MULTISPECIES: FimV/HubP family polar landmark protein [Guyparkeria]MCL7751695.1 hypothetical protein [Guyparkeria hydrothermalis]TKA91200.1 hypothetical protein FAZ79_01275 [Guyparkeria sp. SB14A]
MRKLSLVIAGILGAGTPLISQAATLGEARVQSYLSQPLDVRVPLARSSDEPLDEITVKLAPPSFYREAGVPLENITGNLTFRIASEGGREFVVIGSKRPIRDPILSILLEVDSPQGRMIREYNLLLDPPSIGASQQSRVTAGSTDQPATTASTPRAKPASTAWQRVEPARDVSLDATRDVQRGDTLYEIARDYVDDGADVRPMMQAIIDANPEAFANGNGNALMAGARLKVPGNASADSVASDTADAGQEEGASPVERLPALELLGPENEGGETAATPTELGGFGDLSREQPLAAIADSTQASPDATVDRETALDQEEVESVRAENEALTEQLRALKDQIDSVKVAIDERDAQIAELQEVVQQSRAELAQAQQDSGNFWVQWGKYLTGALGLVVIALLIALGLRRGRRDEEPAIAMPVTADAADRSDTRRSEREPVVESTPPGSSAATTAGAAAFGAAAVGAQSSAGAASEDASEESTSASATGMDDPMNPEMALEEARVLESFNLTHQAVELLQDSLAEHPGHAGLQSALNRLKGIEDAETHNAAVTPSDVDASGEGTQEDDLTPEIGDSDASTAGAPESTDDWSAAEPEGQEGAVDWDDADDMLATPEPEATPSEDDQLMDFDDSFALETPAAEEGDATASTATSGEEPGELELPNNEAPAASVEDQGIETGEPEPLDLDLSGYEPAGEAQEPKATPDEDVGLDLDLGETPASDEQAQDEAEALESAAAEEKAAAADAEADIDTRVGLAEAFLDVGDRESFDMIESELREEGATAALERLEALKARFNAG